MSTDSQTITETRVVTTTETVEKVVCANCKQHYPREDTVRWSPDAGVDGDGCVVAETHPRLCDACSEAVFGYRGSETTVVERATATLRQASPYISPATMRVLLTLGVGVIAVRMALAVTDALAASVTSESFARASETVATPELGIGVFALFPIFIIMVIIATVLQIASRRFP